MKRRQFLKIGSLSLLAVAVMPDFLCSEKVKEKFKEGEITLDTNLIHLGPKRRDSWLNLGDNKKQKSEKRKPIRYKEISADIVVVGGGIAGICAAVSAARHNTKKNSKENFNIILIQDRPMLGGNASSEIHVPINGAYHLLNKFRVDRETGIVEELQLENKYYNPYSYWEIWDHILFSYVSEYPNIKVFLNMQAISTDIEKSFDRQEINKITNVYCWQTTTETAYKISAKIFIDSSGDGMMAASAGAEYRTGREGRSEFNESYAPIKADGWTMGDSIQFQSIDLGHPVKYKAPDFALPYDLTKAKSRKIKVLDCGFWWVELSDKFDNIAKREENRDKLAAYTFGIWDYIKNSGHYPEAENLVLSWVGSIAGRRESRRFIGDYILNQNDMLSYKHFPDAVAFGGWSLDEHCPGGMNNLKDPPSFFHEKFKQLYEIPYRCLYSKNISNLFMAGRDISVSHIALSSTRIMGTCALTGQAVGTAAAMCIKYKINPREIGKKYIDELQETLIRDDIFIPNRPAKDTLDLARKAKISASKTISGNVSLLTDGYSRDELNAIHHWASDENIATISLTWKKIINISKVEMKCDSNLHKIICLHPSRSKQNSEHFGLPSELLKNSEIQAFIDNKWKTIKTINNNKRRCIKTSFEKVTTSRLKIVFKETYGSPIKKLFEIRVYS